MPPNLTTMNYSRLSLATLAATVAYFAFGTLVWVLVPAMKEEAGKFPALFRPHEEMKRVAPVGLIGTLIAVLVVTLLFARIYPQGAGAADGLSFGAFIGAFVVCGFVLHNYANLNIGLKLTALQGVGLFIEWVIVGIVIALVYRG